MRELPSDILIDTTFLLPFFGIPVGVRGFTVTDFSRFVLACKRIHVAELSVYEAKAKILRLSMIDDGYRPALLEFGSNLRVLRGDERFVWHPYSAKTDDRLNELVKAGAQLDTFDAIVVSESAAVGALLTEDREILALRGSPVLQDLAIFAWSDVMGLLSR